MSEQVDQILQRQRMDGMSDNSPAVWRSPARSLARRGEVFDREFCSRFSTLRQYLSDKVLCHCRFEGTHLSPVTFGGLCAAQAKTSYCLAERQIRSAHARPCYSIRDRMQTYKCGAVLPV